MTDRAIELLMQERVAQFTILELQPFSEAVQISDDAARGEYEKNRDRYIQPPQMQVDYLALSVDALAAQAVVTTDAEQAFYDSNTDRFTRPGSRSASHILISVSRDAQEAEVAKARDKAQRLANQGRDGKDFAALAREHSDDPGSAGRGGDLGIIRSGTMAPEFEAAVFELNPGEISDPVRTEYGWHVVMLTDLRESVVSSFADVRSEIRSLLAREWAEDQFMVMAEDFQNMVFEQPGSLEATADFLGLPIQRTDWFSRNAGEGIATHTVLREAAFSDEVRVDRMNSEMIEIDSDLLVAVHFADYRDQRQLDFEEVSKEITDYLAAQGAIAGQEDAANKLVDRLRAGAPWAGVLEEVGLPLYDLPQDAEDIADPDDQSVAQAVYAAPVPIAGQAVYGGARLDAGRYAVYRLAEVVPGNPDEINSEEREQIRSLIGARVGEELYTGASRALRSAANVEVFEENL
jgi:peptidyl-prolyl cis-trans isomerase D